MSNPLKYQVRDLYKKLLFLGREYPSGYENFFRPKLKAAFLKNRDLKNYHEIKKAIDLGEYVIKELETLYYLRKYRSLKRSYYN
ncbi:unnamed protein product [Rhizophagus irregularis]|uniref:LYR motif-containing protein 5B n=2 Tax=Rhizophagus irregularis TaxID=588596 RepID=A0A2I1G6R3_9GLOM|nr:LYR motif-containing protein 5B [Rhizophagus irregularis DAOM 181602=DAOM 197198]PKC65663.1 LYR motif-containing protein 5B [Rhizophagus irregularis]RGB37736.1 LYR motif-containing protein 5B [Rhizophagus diaphanus] [Rhizophagus sp. MUCL 43196]PKK67308.1 LYR motif-containing protein 5B [Rhizophagus irregularis]PKY27862.1 LYR motif-containing protein 5B [Rhizophagus irregularis]PKY42302.1 LYR motif-containing protein 5B [Rhizophagus irregularis]|eukprot:XP_025182436.1 LYR motif-containing protein 5B [Rhizophagus irregularis DAOM 181602=DAOM 197198]